MCCTIKLSKIKYKTNYKNINASCGPAARWILDKLTLLDNNNLKAFLKSLFISLINVSFKYVNPASYLIVIHCFIVFK